jgi:hypothetical protein
MYSQNVSGTVSVDWSTSAGASVLVKEQKLEPKLGAMENLLSKCRQVLILVLVTLD